MDTREQAFFLELRKQLPTDRYLFPKMRIADIVETTNGKGYRRQLYKILPKHVDFLITDHSFRPLFAIELNGSSHNRSDRAESDSLKQAIFSDIGLKLYTVQIGKEFALEIGRILSEQGVLNKA